VKHKNQSERRNLAFLLIVALANVVAPRRSFEILEGLRLLPQMMKSTKKDIKKQKLKKVKLLKKSLKSS
jgi:hypothetical protein